MSNKNLCAAKATKDDEFYTQLSDIEKELKHYKNHFKDKSVLLNCDDPDKSNFWAFFSAQFDNYELKRLTSIHYSDTEPSYMLEMIRLDNGEVIQKRTELLQNGDFRSPESLAALDACDIVVTNPPFSLFREFVATILDHKKCFLIIGNQNAAAYKDMLQHIKNNEVWLGYQSGNMVFKVPPDSEPRAVRYWQDETGQKWRSLGNVCWFTNLDTTKRHENLIMYRTYSEKDYPKYDNYDAIDVPKVSEIPQDYFGEMGVPITFIDKYNPDQFEIIGKLSPVLNGKSIYTRIIIKRKTGENGNDKHES